MPKIILFDGVCNLCNGAVDFVINHDKNDLFLFASLQSDIGQHYLQKFNLPLNDYDTFVLIEGDDFYTASTATLLVAKDLSGFVRLLYLLIYIPKFLRDAIYRLIAKNRYSLFGRRDRCRIVSEKESEKFLD